MTNSINMFRKRISLVGFLLFFTLAAYAQTEDNAGWNCSKDVQKIANKSLFQNESLKQSHLQIEIVGIPNVVLSKSIHKSDEVAKNNVASKGIPSIAISKGVAFIGKK